MLIESYSSPAGEIILCAHEGALRGLWFRGQKYEMRGVDSGLPETVGEAAVLDKARRWLNLYFAGGEPTLDFPLDPQGTAFQKLVWMELLSIPYRHTVSYGELAERIGCKSARAVGSAIGKNPISLIIPCHRVLGADGRLTGYAGGVERKIYLLDLEQGKCEYEAK